MLRGQCMHGYIQSCMYNNYHISWKYWQELNLAVGPKIAIGKILADLNLAVR